MEAAKIISHCKRGLVALASMRPVVTGGSEGSESSELLEHAWLLAIVSLFDLFFIFSVFLLQHVSDIAHAEREAL